jgi:hypothetical protein
VLALPLFREKIEPDLASINAGGIRLIDRTFVGAVRKEPKRTLIRSLSPIAILSVRAPQFVRADDQTSHGCRPSLSLCVPYGRRSGARSRKMALVPRVPTDLLIRAYGAIGHAAFQSDRLNAATAALAHPGGPDPAQAIILRLIAFRKVPTNRVPSGWSIAIEGRTFALTERALFEAAAQAPLRTPRSMLMKDLAFRPHELLSIALTSVPPLSSPRVSP